MEDTPTDRAHSLQPGQDATLPDHPCDCSVAEKHEDPKPEPESRRHDIKEEELHQDEKDVGIQRVSHFEPLYSH